VDFILPIAAVSFNEPSLLFQWKMGEKEKEKKKQHNFLAIICKVESIVS